MNIYGKENIKTIFSIVIIFLLVILLLCDLVRKSVNIDVVISQPFGIMREIPIIFYVSLFILSVAPLIALVKKMFFASLFLSLFLVAIKTVVPYLMFKTLVSYDAYGHLNNSILIAEEGSMFQSYYGESLSEPTLYAIVSILQVLSNLDFYSISLFVIIISKILLILTVFILANMFFGRRVAALSAFWATIPEPFVLHFSPFALMLALYMPIVYVLFRSLTFSDRRAVVLAIPLIYSLASGYPLATGFLLVFCILTFMFFTFNRIFGNRILAWFPRVNLGRVVNYLFIIFLVTFAHTLYYSSGFSLQLIAHGLVGLFTLNPSEHRYTGGSGFMEPMEEFQMGVTQIWLISFYVITFLVIVLGFSKLLLSKLSKERNKRVVQLLLLLFLYIFSLSILNLVLRATVGFSSRVHPALIPVSAIVASALLMIFLSKKRKVKSLIIITLLILSVSSVISTYPREVYRSVVIPEDLQLAHFGGQYPDRQKYYRISGIGWYQDLFWPYLKDHLKITTGPFGDEFLFNVKENYQYFLQTDIIIVNKDVVNWLAKFEVEKSHGRDYVVRLTLNSELQLVYNNGYSSMYSVRK